MPSSIVEPMIAASIVYVGIENIVRKGKVRWRQILAFTFGLVHGLGFASALREVGVGVDGMSVIILDQ
jgi:HupE / UreJ protein